MFVPLAKVVMVAWKVCNDAVITVFKRYNHKETLNFSDIKIRTPKFSNHSWLAFAALRGAYKHVQVIDGINENTIVVYKGSGRENS